MAGKLMALEQIHTAAIRPAALLTVILMG